MTYTRPSLKTRRRNLEASLRYWLLGKAGRAQVRSALRHLTPFETDVPLVRIGGQHDGGYLLPDDLDGLVASFSPGVSYNMDFDLALMKRGLPCFLADASIDGLVEPHPLAHFDKLFLGPRTQGNFISLDDWVAMHAPPEGDLILQMDIEGAEFETLAAASEATLRRFRIILVEFHGMHRMFSRKHAKARGDLFERLAQIFTLVHLHPNNASTPVKAGPITIPPVFEATFLRSDRIERRQEATEFPHPLDEPNVAGLPDDPIPDFWRQ
jgi:hypothetical protein